MRGYYLRFLTCSFVTCGAGVNEINDCPQKKKKILFAGIAKYVWQMIVLADGKAASCFLKCLW